MTPIKSPVPQAAVAAPVMDAVQSASARTGIDFDYLVDVARVESRFNPTAQAPTSSARGLFQFGVVDHVIDESDLGGAFGVDEIPGQEHLKGMLSCDHAAQGNLGSRAVEAVLNTVGRKARGARGNGEIAARH